MIRKARLLAALPLLAAATTGCDSLRALGAPEAPLWLHHPGGALSIEMRRTVTAETRQAGEKYERGRPEIDPELWQKYGRKASEKPAAPLLGAEKAPAGK